MYNVADRFVQIQGELFPAVNIQIWSESPELHTDEDGVTYGIYFELMFESAHYVIVYQESVADIEVKSESSCNDINHFLIDVVDGDDAQYGQIEYSYHCDGEEELLERLLQEKYILTNPSEFSAIAEYV